MKKYIAFFFLFSIGLSTLVGMFNLIVNPYLYFSPSIDLPGFNDRKYFAGIDGFRIWKSQRISDDQYDAVFIGSSRVMVGLNPDDAAELKTFNLGLPMTNILELDLVSSYVARQAHLKEVIIGLDFLLFSDRRAIHPSYYRSHFSGDRLLGDQLTDVLSLRSTLTSVSTVGANLASVDLPCMQSNGFLPRTTSAVPVRERFDRVLTQNFLINPETYANYHYSSELMDHFRAMLERLMDSGKRVRVFISPVHARQLLVVQELGLWNTYKQWLSDVTRVVSEVSHATGQCIPLIDFGGFNRYTQEPIPHGDTREMAWYFESSHYRHELGRLLLRQLLAARCEFASGELGVSLNPAALDRRLAQLDDGLMRYRRAKMDEVQAVKRLITETAVYRTHRAEAGR